MNRITSFSPSPALAPYVHCIRISKTTNANGQPPIVIPPGGYVLLTLLTDQSRYDVKLYGKEFQSTPRAALIGQHYGAMTVKTDYSEINTISVAFKATALHRLWGVCMNKLTHHISDANLVLGNELTSLTERLQQSEPDHVNIEIVNQFLERSTHLPCKKYAFSESVIDLMNEKQGIISIRGLSDYFRCTPRLIERKFNEQVGVSPKYLCRVIQFNQMLAQLKCSKEVKWTDLACQFGYYDQAHLIKTFIEFTGKSPVNYFESYNRFIHPAPINSNKKMTTYV